MNTSRLNNFLILANQAGYASGEEKKWTKESDSSTSINFENNEWRMHDNFFGGEPYGGRIIVFRNLKPYWMMVYYGWVKEGITTKDVYGVLQGALRLMPEEAPFRGPSVYNQGDFVYKNGWEGTVERYKGEEIISIWNQEIYKANYMGGLVDQIK
jgi:hypothetical protein